MSLFLALLAVTASAVDWNDAELGQFYPVAEAEETELAEASAAVVWFGNATGFLVSPDGYILTNHHVYTSFGDLGTVTRQWVGQIDAELMDVELVVANAAYDVAVYKVASGGKHPWIPIRTSTPEVGERVAVIGHPYSRTQQVSYGRVLADDLIIGGNPSVEYSAQTWWGSSGSPVVDTDGRALGLHWGWDSDGKSNGRLTGIPFDQMVRGVPEVNRIAQEWGASSPGVAEARCASSDAFWIDSTLMKRSVSTNGAGKDLDAVRLTLRSAVPACDGAVAKVTYHLHPTFHDSTPVGNRQSSGHPVVLNTWGFFRTWADVQLTSGGRVVVSGYVAWER